ncbi:J domain-containing protein [Zavarzinella formosa]|uniref:J domain-containing protein n=1 Tax=Zavarzinella formosa TaxID=360055 RepID=UPI000362264C|nr:J domain-containing protein [Zavarzinella formosa]
MIEASPLSWPPGKPRVQYPTRSHFRTTHGAACQFVLGEIRRLGGTLPIISTNIPLRKDGLPYATYKAPDDRGVAVYFTYRKQQMCFACDKWDIIHDNIYAIGKTIEALRGIERWGTGEMVQQAFKGFIALPSNSPWDVLGLKPGSSSSEIELAFRDKAKRCHPDVGGSHDQMARLNEARTELLRRSA